MKLTNTYLTKFSVFIGILGCIAVVFSLSSVQEWIQKLKYGDPKHICLHDLGIQVANNWKINLIDYGGSDFPMLFGVLPIPRLLTNLDGKLASIQLYEINIERLLIIYPNTPSINSSELIDNCKKNSACIVKSYSIGDTLERSILVNDGRNNWITLLDRNAMIATQMPRLDGVILEKCGVKRL